jgi:hypothetical protein
MRKWGLVKRGTADDVILDWKSVDTVLPGQYELLDMGQGE